MAEPSPDDAERPARRPRRRRSPAAGERIRDPERTRGWILDAARAEFAAKGYSGARIGEIAARAKVNKQLISYYFGGKEGLYQAISERWQGDEAAVDHSGMSLADLVTGYVATSRHARDLLRLLAWDGLSDDTEDPGAAIRTARMRAAVADLRERQRNGELADDLDPACVLLAFFAAAAAPTTLPQVARSIFGVDADADLDKATAHYADQLTKMVRRLAEP